MLKLNEQVRQSAIVALKTFIQENWTNTEEDGFQIFPKDKETLRDSILDALIKCVDKPKIL